MKSIIKISLALCVSFYAAMTFAAIQGKEIHYTAVDGSQLVGYYVYDDAIKVKRPGILVVHEWWGLNNFARHRATQLAKLGYAAMAIDMNGEGKHTERASEALEIMHGVFNHASTSMIRAKAGLELLKAQPQVDPTQIGAMGYCFGGKIVLDMARAGLPLNGVASFHGVLATTTPAKAGEVKAKILVLQSAADTMVLAADAAAFKAEMKAAHAPYEFVVYPNVNHGFSSPDANRLEQENKMREFFNGVFAEKH
jgi:dienelactone hydrolase